MQITIDIDDSVLRPGHVILPHQVARYLQQAANRMTSTFHRDIPGGVFHMAIEQFEPADPERRGERVGTMRINMKVE